MPPQPHRPADLAWQVFRGSDAVRRGLLTEHQLRSSAWIRLRHDVYADARLDRDHALACRAAALRVPTGVLIAGPSAAYLHGVRHAATFTDEVHVLVPRPMRLGAQRRLRIHTGDPTSTPADPGPLALRRENDAVQLTALTPLKGHGGPLIRPDTDARRPGRPRTPTSVITTMHPGKATAPVFRQITALPRTDPGQAAWETAVWLEPVRAVGIVDALLGQGLTSPNVLAAVADANADRPGGRRARWVFALADPGAQSPPESHLRVRLVLAGLPRPVVQHPVRLPAGLVLHPDLAWPEYRVAVEYDGQWHADPERLHTDRRRLNQLVAAGWLVLHVTSRRMHQDFPGVLREVRAALSARGWRP
ncbi:DUF559 domain-containing protein [Micromonospora sp. NPDC094482]|uniref:endonuclease domain-containing protein n=1 Tax=unclassified Micromonospora TaxID=2617518 RepID=UPI0033187DF1